MSCFLDWYDTCCSVPLDGYDGYVMTILRVVDDILDHDDHDPYVDQRDHHQITIFERYPQVMKSSQPPMMMKWGGGALVQFCWVIAIFDENNLLEDGKK